MEGKEKKIIFKDEHLHNAMSMVAAIADANKMEDIIAGVAILSELVLVDIKMDMFKSMQKYMSIEKEGDGNEYIICKVTPEDKNYELLKEAIENGFESEDDDPTDDDANAYA